MSDTHWEREKLGHARRRLPPPTAPRVPAPGLAPAYRPACLATADDHGPLGNRLPCCLRHFPFV
jgi:hypothetical protein